MAVGTTSRGNTARYARRVLIVIEGVDGAGKRTLTNGLRAAFEAAHKSVAILSLFEHSHHHVLGLNSDE